MMKKINSLMCVFNNTPPEIMGSFLAQNLEEIFSKGKPFAQYMRRIFKDACYPAGTTFSLKAGGGK